MSRFFSFSSVIKLLFIALPLIFIVKVRASEFEDPVLSISQVLDVAEDYLLGQPNIDRQKYFLSSIHFGYFLTDGDDPIKPKWMVSYTIKTSEEKGKRLHASFYLNVSNEPDPTIEINHGL